jgi:hypothetical protein
MLAGSEGLGTTTHHHTPTADVADGWLIASPLEFLSASHFYFRINTATASGLMLPWNDCQSTG